MMQVVVQAPSSAKSVTFSTKAKMMLVFHISEYDSKEIEAAFYQSDDFVRFRQDAKITAQLIENGYRANGIEFCGRGVEALTREGMVLQYINRKMARLAVFTEQERLYRKEQQEHPIAEESHVTAPVDEAIADAYAMLVGESISSAYASALSDENIVQSELNGGERKNETAALAAEKEQSGNSRYRHSRRLTKMKKHGNFRLRRLTGASSAA
jgi:hypothetical protein